ncbi:hypothetical protein HS125_16600 [bacterium]|nr:hypothetical protein [bacterium]
MSVLGLAVSALLLSATADEPVAPPSQLFPPLVPPATGIHSLALPDATGAGFELTEVHFLMGAAVRDAATSTFSGRLRRIGEATSVRLRAGIVRNTTLPGPTPWVWQDSQVFQATGTEPTAVEVGVSVPSLLPEGLARRFYRPHVELEPPEGAAVVAAAPITFPVTVESRLGLVLEDVQVTLTAPGTPHNDAVFTGRMLQKGIEARVTLRGGFVRAAGQVWDQVWFLRKEQDFPTPARERTLEFEMAMDAPPMLHIGVANGVYVPMLEIVAEPEPSLPSSSEVVLTASDGLSLVHWEYTLTAPEMAGNTAVFSGTLENTTSKAMDVIVRAGFQPTQPLLVEGRLRSVAYWPWSGEQRVSHLEPGKPTPFRVEFAAPPKMGLYLSIPSYKPAIQLLAAP